MSNSSPDASLTRWLSRPLSFQWIAGLTEGASAVWKGAAYLRRHRELWPFALAPILLNAILTAVLLAALVAVAVWFLSSAHPWFTSKRAESEIVWLSAELALGVIVIVGCLALTLLAWKVLGGVLCGFFYNKLAEQAERQLGVADGELRSLTWGHEVVDTLLNLAALLGVNVALLFIGLVPVAGSAIALVGGVYCNCFLVGLDFMAVPVALRGERRIAQFRFARMHSRQTIGLGAVALVLQFLPIIGAVFLTSAVVGAVLLHRRSRLGRD